MVGFRQSLDFFNPIKRPAKLRGVVVFFLGITLVLLRWTFVGFILELIGMVSLFGGFLPTVITFLRNVPFIGPFLSFPVVAGVIDMLAGTRPKRAPV